MLDAYPQMLLLGDRNLTLDGIPAKPGFVTITTNVVGWTSEVHNNLGNIGLADGSVMQLSTAKLQQMVQGTMTNRLVVP
jgi:prepilin-type processing-associated H-X9-DG protein